MSTLQDLKDKMTQLANDIASEKAEVQGLLTSLKAQVQALTDQLSAGTPVTQADLDALVAAFDALDLAVRDISEPPIPTP